MDDDNHVQTKNALVTDKDIFAAVIENGNQDNQSGSIDLLQYECKDIMMRQLGVEEMIIPEAILTSCSNRAVRTNHRQEVYNGLFSSSWVDCQARARGPHQQFAASSQCGQV